MFQGRAQQGLGKAQLGEAPQQLRHLFFAKPSLWCSKGLLGLKLGMPLGRQLGSHLLSFRVLSESSTATHCHQAAAPTTQPCCDALQQKLVSPILRCKLNSSHPFRRSFKAYGTHRFPSEMGVPTNFAQPVTNCKHSWHGVTHSLEPLPASRLTCATAASRSCVSSAALSAGSTVWPRSAALRRRRKCRCLTRPRTAMHAMAPTSSAATKSHPGQLGNSRFLRVTLVRKTRPSLGSRYLHFGLTLQQLGARPGLAEQVGHAVQPWLATAHRPPMPGSMPCCAVTWRLLSQLWAWSPCSSRINIDLEI